MPGRGLTILFSGMIAADAHQGGATWAVLQYLLGLEGLGHDVYFVEPIEERALRPVQRRLQQMDPDSSPTSSVGLLNTKSSEDPTLEHSANAAYFRDVMTAFGLQERAALLLAGTRNTVGMPYVELCRVAQRADLLVSVSGMLTDEALLERIPLRVYLDLDPAFNQLWSAAEGIDMRFAAHNRFVTIGQAIGEPGCAVPTCGLSWIKTVQPVVLDQWPVVEDLGAAAFTTIANWRGYGSIEHEGVFYGQKAHSFRQFIDLPRLTAEQFVVALAIHPGETKDLAALDGGGWELADPVRVAGTPAAYQRFVQRSKAELGIAKSGYVASRCGWFSDRSLCYLASGRPVLAQETGFSRYLPVGEGLFSFSTADDVMAAIEALRADYPRQRRSARALAEAYFDSRDVLTRLLERVGVGSAP